MKTKTILLLAVAACGLTLGGCVTSGPSRPVARANVVVVEDDYEYYPGYEVYYSPAHHYYYYRDGAAWVRRNDPPRGWVRGSASVRMHFNDAPEHHHAEVIKQYPRTWRPRPVVVPEKRRDRDDHDRDHDRDRDRDNDHDRDKH